ncbi:MAG TPA: DUF72 domain-containing protein [Polyangia bacterium]|jgi:uncharacterized protein YecE (DUF72 family)|nr:DUF72 domain-containing protein [Polyangia bacterium]
MSGPTSRKPAPRSGRVRVGTSGWQYPRWRGDFYPKGLRHADELAYLGQRLSSVEVNGTFYSLTRPSTCTLWRRTTPADFVFAIKGSRYITHMLKLRNSERAVANFFASGILRLGSQLGPILWQLPPQLPFDRERALRFFAALPRDVAGAERWARRHDARTTGRATLRAPDGRQAPLRHAVEVRHPSWVQDQALATLRELDLALVAADTAGRHPLSCERTAGFAYVRLHGSTALYASRYTDAELGRWAGLIGDWAAAGDDVYVYFDNDAHGHAPHDAVRLAARVDSGAASRPLFLDGAAKSMGSPGLRGRAPVQE